MIIRPKSKKYPFFFLKTVPYKALKRVKGIKSF